MSPFAGATLLLLVSLVIASTPGAARAAREAALPERWTEVRPGRTEVSEDERAQPPARPLARKAQWVLPPEWAAPAIEPARCIGVVSGEACERPPHLILVRSALLGLPPPSIA